MKEIVIRTPEKLKGFIKENSMTEDKKLEIISKFYYPSIMIVPITFTADKKAEEQVDYLYLIDLCEKAINDKTEIISLCKAQNKFKNKKLGFLG